MSEIFSKFTTHYQNIFVLAKASATTSGVNEITPADLLLALTAERGSLAAEILEKHNLTTETLNKKLKRTLPTERVTKPHGLTDEALLNLLTINVAPSVREIVERSVATAWKHEHHYIGSEHLLYSLTASTHETVKELWDKLEVDVKILKSNITAVLKSTSKFPDLTEAFTTTREGKGDKNKNAFYIEK